MTTPTDIAAVRALQEQAAALPFGEPGIDYDPAFDVVRAVPALLDELERTRTRLRALESNMRHAFGPNWGKAPTDAEEPTE